MKKIKILYSGMSGIFDPENNFITNTLRKYFIVEISENPDFLIYSVNSADYLKYKCVRIYYTPENLVPDFNICDYALGFNYIDFGDRYLRFPIYMADTFKAYADDEYSNDLFLAQHKHEEVDIFSKTDFCSFVYSNSEAAACREKIFNALSEYKKVNSGGRYLNNCGGAVNNKLEFQRKHKFVIAFENTSTSGYTTEKIVHAFAAGSVPIYWGNPDIVNEFNPKSFINCHDFGLTNYGENDAIKAIVSRVAELDQDDEQYKQMLLEPAFIRADFIERMYKDFEDYLVHIFSQEVEDAYRRNRFYWGERYERKQRIGNWFYWQCRKVIPIRDWIRKVLRRDKGTKNRNYT